MSFSKYAHTTDLEDVKRSFSISLQSNEGILYRNADWMVGQRHQWYAGDGGVEGRSQTALEFHIDNLKNGSIYNLTKHLPTEKGVISK